MFYTVSLREFALYRRSPSTGVGQWLPPEENLSKEGWFRKTVQTGIPEQSVLNSGYCMSAARILGVAYTLWWVKW